MKSTQADLGLPATLNGQPWGSLYTKALLAQGKAMTSLIPGLAESLDMKPRELRRKNGPALAEAERVLESLLLPYLSSPQKPLMSLIMLTSHLTIMMRRHPLYSHLPKQAVYDIVCRQTASQLCLFFP